MSTVPVVLPSLPLYIGLVCRVSSSFRTFDSKLFLSSSVCVCARSVHKDSGSPEIFGGCSGAGSDSICWRFLEILLVSFLGLFLERRAWRVEAYRYSQVGI